MDDACSLNYFIILVRKDGNNLREYRMCSGTTRYYYILSSLYIYVYIFVICWLVGVSWGIIASDKAAYFQLMAGCSPQSDTDY